MSAARCVAELGYSSGNVQLPSYQATKWGRIPYDRRRPPPSVASLALGSCCLHVCYCAGFSLFGRGFVWIFGAAVLAMYMYYIGRAHPLRYAKSRVQWGGIISQPIGEIAISNLQVWIAIRKFQVWSAA